MALADVLKIYSYEIFWWYEAGSRSLIGRECHIKMKNDKRESKERGDEDDESKARSQHGSILLKYSGVAVNRDGAIKCEEWKQSQVTSRDAS